MSVKTQNSRLQVPRSAPQARFWGENPKRSCCQRQYRQEDQNPIARKNKPKNAARAWLRFVHDVRCGEGRERERHASTRRS
jgi:hypothetical protein